MRDILGADRFAAMAAAGVVMMFDKKANIHLLRFQCEGDSVCCAEGCEL